MKKGFSTLTGEARTTQASAAIHYPVNGKIGVTVYAESDEPRFVDSLEFVEHVREKDIQESQGFAPLVASAFEQAWRKLSNEFRQRGDVEGVIQRRELLLKRNTYSSTVLFTITARLSKEDVASAAYVFLKRLPSISGGSWGPRRYRLRFSLEPSRFAQAPGLEYAKGVSPREQAQQYILENPKAESILELAQECLPSSERRRLRELILAEGHQSRADTRQEIGPNSALNESGTGMCPEVARLNRTSIESIDQDRKRRFAEITSREVFGDAEVSVAGFRAYLRKLRGHSDSSYDEKREICRTVNFWKDSLQVELVYDGQACSLGPKTSGGKGGGFLVKAVGQGRKSLWSKAGFPPLRVRLKD